MAHYYYKQLFPVDHVHQLLKDGYAVDGTGGGLILGPSHEDGGIYMLQFIGIGYSLIGEIEGYEYFFNPASTAYYFKSYSHLNDYRNDMKEDFVEYSIPNNITVIDTHLQERHLYNSKFLIFDHRFDFAICNKFSTSKHLQVLNNLNKSVYHEYDNSEYSLTTRMNIFHTDSREKIWSIRNATKDDDPSDYLWGSVIK